MGENPVHLFLYFELLSAQPIIIYFYPLNLLLLLLLLSRFIAFDQAILNAETFLLGELQLVAKGQEDAFILHV